MLVEDDERLRTLARKALERYSYAVIDAANGDEALRLCEIHEGAIDLLLADVVMPGMTGQQYAERSEQQHGGPGSVCVSIRACAEAAVPVRRWQRVQWQ